MGQGGAAIILNPAIFAPAADPNQGSKSSCPRSDERERRERREERKEKREKGKRRERRRGERKAHSSGR